MTAPSSRERWRLYLAGVLVASTALVGAAALAITRKGERSAAAHPGDPVASTRALVFKSRKGPAARHLEIAGEARPFASVTLYAKVSGYLRSIDVDRGDRVRANQVLAVIQSPEIDRQHQAAVADAAYKRASAASAEALTGPGAISARQVEAERTSAEVAEAVLAGLETQKEFTVLRAPFPGTITARFADPGALVQNATNAQSGALPVVTVSQTDRLRVQAYVDQRNAQLVHLGDAAQVTIPESGLMVPGTVTRANGELDPRTRTMLVEIHLDNRDGRILPGSFVRVRLTVKSPPLVDVPAEALLWRDGKTLLPVLGPGNRIELRPVLVGHFDGALVGISAGLAPDESVALNLGRSVRPGDLIDPVVAPAPR